MSPPLELRRAAEIARAVIREGIGMLKPGASVLEICEAIERRIRELGGEPAFPVNISVDHVAAHYTAKPGDQSRLRPGSLVKLDVGVHIDGFIVDAAVTIEVGTSIMTPLIAAARRALEAAIFTIKPGVRVSQVGAAVERAIKAMGFKPIYNLTGHKIERYVLHGGVSVPNYEDRSARYAFREGDVFAVEPFATNGRGEVVDGDEVTIYRVLRVVDRLQETKALYEATRGLPFSPRWFPQIPLEFYPRAVRAGALYGYPVLIEAGRGLVAQFEDTVYVDRDGAVPLVGTLELAD